MNERNVDCNVNCGAGATSWVELLERIMNNGTGERIFKGFIEILDKFRASGQEQKSSGSEMEAALDQALAEGRMTSEEYLRFKALLRAD